MPILIEFAFQVQDSNHLIKKIYFKRNGADSASAAPGFYCLAMLWTLCITDVEAVGTPASLILSELGRFRVGG